MRPDLTHDFRRMVDPEPLHRAPAVPPAPEPVPVERPRAPQPLAPGGDVPTLEAGRRAAPRLRLTLPAQLVAVEEAHACILLNLSRTGAQVAVLDGLREGEGAILRCGVISAFAMVTRTDIGRNALMFDEPLSDAEVLETQRYHEAFEEREKRALLETARKWATGDTSDDRSI